MSYGASSNNIFTKPQLLIMKVAVILAVAGSALARTFTVYNACPFTIWPAIFTDLNAGSSVPAIENGWEAPAYSKRSFTVPDDWKSGRIWGRTQCDFSKAPVDIKSCLTGGCNGGLVCDGRTGVGLPPVTFAEFTLGGTGQSDYTDVSLG
ncbi:Pathogenesis-related protein 5 OS=Arabidopsis thaliana GN=At1g75040 PE=1 SV=1 [Rhizoctonia solani AG-1 IB]|uniref:Pathogenesis-related protein 5 n=1 Tax=Thanatephorus cucumeris (strain AG1-IB / isolate 7/3/14) TaxID=1108050 RepID=A0A0B7F508_THACB|nr:Pathogenesis-related protein 5 OS=Arabidopsis thaliana GN=At1g75040 PE=1 SV=1 [Rhizoctonia solani AG-1 IB]